MANINDATEVSPYLTYCSSARLQPTLHAFSEDKADTCNGAIAECDNPCIHTACTQEADRAMGSEKSTMRCLQS